MATMGCAWLDPVDIICETSFVNFGTTRSPLPPYIHCDESSLVEHEEAQHSAELSGLRVYHHFRHIVAICDHVNPQFSATTA